MSARPSTFVHTQIGPYRLYSIAELLRMPPPMWLIEGVMPAGGFVALYGPPGVGKSFIALDMGLSVASGGHWQGHAIVKSGYVVYVSAEGGSGLGKRVQAWLTVRGIEPAQATMDCVIEPIPINTDSEGMETLLRRINMELERTPTLIIIDTLARCFDGDENQQEDMGRFVGGVDRLRQEFGCTVLVVHHTRLDGERERGNTAFRGAADTMLSVNRNGSTLSLSCNKQKDAEEFDDIALRLKIVPAHESCVIELPRQGRQAAKQLKTLDILSILSREGPLSFDAWLGSSMKRGVSRATFKRHLVILKQNEEIIKENGQYRVYEE